jgi:DNA mismatch repair protein MutS
MREEYQRLYKEHSKTYGKNTCIFLEVGKFYEMYDKIQEDSGVGETSMKEAVEILNIQISYKDNNEIFAGIPIQSLHKYASILTKEGWTVVVVDQEKGGPQNKVLARNVSQILSPGTHIESFNNSASYIGTLLLESKGKDAPYFSISVADISTGRSLSYSSKLEGKFDSWNFDRLLHFFQVHTLKELVVLYKGINPISELFLKQNLQIPNTVLHIKPYIKSNINSKELMKLFFYNKSIISIYEKLNIIPDSNIDISFTHLLLFLNDHSKQVLEEHVLWNPDDSVYLGNNVLNQLNMISNTEESVFSYFEKTFTSMGKRAIYERMLYPICDINVLSMRIYRLETVMNLDNNIKKQIESFLKQIGDLQRIHHKFYSYNLNSNDILILEQSYNRILSIITILNNTNISSNSEFCESLESYLEFFKTHFNVEKAKEDPNDVSFLNNNLAPKTYILEEKIKEQKTKANVFLNTIQKFSNENNIKFEEKETNLYSIEGSRRIMTNIDTKFKNTKKELWPYNNINITIRKTTGTLTSTYLEDLHNNTIVYRNKLKNTIKEELIPVCNNFCDTFKDFWLVIEDYVCDIDILFSLAKVCKEKNFTKPIYLDNEDGSGFKIEGLRHPLIESQNTRVEYVKHNISLDSSNCGYLLYGMNASGKSSLMKAVGIAVLLAQVGCYVPSDLLILKPYKGIYTRILNKDNIYAGLSSFAVEMLELREILKKADKYSLVLGDELCSGTESVSATSLVASGIIWLHKKGTSFIFATHYHGLNDIPQVKELKGLKIYHLKVNYDPINDILIYDRNLVPGPGNTYYGLEVAKAMCVPSDYLELANTIRKELLDEKIKESSYNKNIIVQCCEVCNNKINNILEVHHIVQQKEANNEGILPNGFHKNNARNLIVLCQICHDKHHAGNLIIGPLKQTSNGEIRVLEEKKTIPKSKWKNEELTIIHSYFKKYPSIGLKRLAYELETNEDIKISESSLRTLRKEI